MNSTQSNLERLHSANLTPREVEVVAMHAVDGLTARNIAARLGRTERTIYRIAARALVKLDRAGLPLLETPRPLTLRYSPATFDLLRPKSNGTFKLPPRSRRRCQSSVHV